ncbi:MAG: FIST C-terminal domain-containing protein [Candidatus Omnitrophica bacterium]|jgi:hypothetical protein|nr:FIST C-terminal domain-containing protein [Candidatus Omnitrophota bacterium]
MQIGVGISRETEPLLAGRDASRQALYNLKSPKADLAIVFNCAGSYSKETLKVISSYIGDIPIFGCGGTAIICDYGILKHGLIIMLISLVTGENFTIASAAAGGGKNPSQAAEELSDKLIAGFQNIRRDFGIILTDQKTDFMSGLQKRLGKSFPMVGGYLSDTFLPQKNSLYSNMENSQDAIIGMLWAGKINFGIGAAHGWKPLGKPRQVTASDDNVVYEIDGQPAINIYKEYFAKDSSGINESLRRISILYPLGIHLDEEYLLRNITCVNNNGSLSFQGNIPVGSWVRLMIGTKESCLNATRQAIAEAQQNLDLGKIKFVLVFNSISRYILLGRHAKHEIEILRKGIPGHAQLLGIYTHGEIAPLKGLNYQGTSLLHNQTISVLAVTG